MIFFILKKKKNVVPELVDVLRELITDLKEQADYGTNYVERKSLIQI